MSNGMMWEGVGFWRENKTSATYHEHTNEAKRRSVQ